MAKWNAQWMQEPSSEEGAIIKREWWRRKCETIPPLKHIIQSYDMLLKKHQIISYNNGVFNPDLMNQIT